MAYNYKQGQYTPKNPHKYVGDLSKIYYRSSYELQMHQFFDMNPNVLRWSSEEVVVPYVKPTDGKVHRYFVDYWVEYRDKDGNINVELIEVKPLQQTRNSRSKNTKTRINEQITYAVNVAKWQCAQQYAIERGWKFRIITERSLFR